MPRVERTHGVSVRATECGQTSAKNPKSCTMQKVRKRKVCVERGAQAGTHRESARSGDADDGERAEGDSALPRCRHLVRDCDLLGLGRVLRLALGRLGLLGHGASLALLLARDLEPAGLVEPSREAAVLSEGGEGRGQRVSL